MSSSEQKIWSEQPAHTIEISAAVLGQEGHYDRSKLHELDVALLLRFLPESGKKLGGTVDATVREVFDEFLSAGKDRYATLPGGKYMLYLEANRSLGAFKTDIMRKEIRRRICKIAYEKQDAILDRTAPAADAGPSPGKKKARAWKKPSATDGKALLLGDAPPVDYNLLASRTDVYFRPVWNVPKNHVTGYIARHESEELNVEDGKSGADHVIVNQRAEADIGLLVRAAKELTRALDEGRKAILIVPVFFDTLTHSPCREQYFEFCSRIPPQARSLMVMQVKKIPAHVPKDRVREVQKDIASLMRAVIITLDLRGQSLDFLMEKGIHACSVSLPQDVEGEHQNIWLMERFAEKMQAISRAAMVDNITSKSMLCAALGAGFTYIAGPAVQADSKNLDMIRPLELQSLYEA